MGYYTNFNLETEEQIDIQNFINIYDECLLNNQNFLYPFDNDIDYIKELSKKDQLIKNTILSLESYDETKWYEHIEDMQTLSKKIPNVIFILSGYGEEPGDIWKAYFKNGKYKKIYAEIVFPEFDKNLLN